MSKVRYKLVPSYPGYAVGDDGTVLSRMSPNGKGTGWSPWRKLKPKMATGRPVVTLRRDRISTDHSVSQLVLLAFVGPCPTGMECCHFPDRDPTNNHLGNLRWASHSDNMQDAMKHGTFVRGSRSNMAKLTEEQVKEIRALAAQGFTRQALAERYEVGLRHIFKILRGEIWTVT